ncbi:MAG: DUF3322 domain-containing protein [Pseudomonadota bacterium]|nr:DUF3322 domain-containing protein [Pseudomonadota bacterium]
MRFPADIREHLLAQEWNHRLHFRERVLQARVETFIPLKPPSGKVAMQDIGSFRRFLDAWAAVSTDSLVCWENRTLRGVGRVRVPTHVTFSSTLAIAEFLGPEAIDRLRQLQARLKPFGLVASELRLAAARSIHALESLPIEVCELLASAMGQMRPGLGTGMHLRALPLHGVDTKLVERHRPLVEVLMNRWLEGGIAEVGGLLAWLGCQVPWRDRWNVVREIPRGGQALAYVVARKANPAAGSFFLKMFDGAGTERRARMFREVTCYRTLSHPGIPKLIESNAAEYEDRTAQLYLVTELVAGKNLGQYDVQNRLLSAADAVNIFGQLLDIVEYTHAQEVVHRDIKPENVMVESLAPLKVRLVDFGLSFLGAEHDDDNHSTAIGQEIGNRFLRLPEHGVSSVNKRDARSDLTQCVGLLFFALTGLRPSLLEDENRRRPHQRADARERLARHVDLDLFSLLNVFDKAFEIDIDARWQTVEELRRALSKIQTTARKILLSDDSGR